MSLNTHHSAFSILQHDPDTIREVLLDIENLPAWNPAFSHVGTANSDGSHPITIHNLLKGELTHTQPAPGVIHFHITIPGLTEESTFTFSPDPQGTKITHTINQQGFLTAIIGEQEASLVPGKRLTRLAHILDASHTITPHEQRNR